MADTSALIEFYEIDASNHSPGTILRYCNYVQVGSSGDFTFDGEDYTPVAIESDGWEKSLDGGLPTPTVTVGDPGYTVSRLVRSLTHLRQSKLTRRRITLDNINTPSLQDPPEVYLINNPSYNPGVSVTLNLRSPLDFGFNRYPLRTNAALLNE